MSGVSTLWPWPECPLEQLPLGQGCIYGRPVSTPSELDDLGGLEHVEWKARWRHMMAHPLSFFLEAIAAKGIQYLTCTLCSTDHAFAHCPGPKHYNHIWMVKSDLVNRGVGYVERRDYFWQVVTVGRGLAMRFNHLDGAIEGWRPTDGMRLGPLAQRPDQFPTRAPIWQVASPTFQTVGTTHEQRQAVGLGAQPPMAELEASEWLGGEWPLRVCLSSEEQIDIIAAALADKLRGELRRRGGILEVKIEARPGPRLVA